MSQQPDTPTPAKKPWYLSKIVLLAGASAGIYLGNALTGFLTGAGVTLEQIEIISATEPQIAQAIEEYRTGQNVLGTTVGVLIPALVAIARRWFTFTILR